MNRGTVKEQLSLYRAKGKDKLVRPFLKWAGGKRQLLPEIRRYLPKEFEIYYEPFLGAGAVLFDLQPAVAVVNDVNEELINCYEVIRDFPSELLRTLASHENSKDYFYWMREIDRNGGLSQLSKVERASRLIYLNKTCFNGLYRVNSKGEFNTPFGHYKAPNYIQPSTLNAISHYLNRYNIELVCADFKEAVMYASSGDFIYFDPPYLPVSSTSSFTSYSQDSFSLNDQIRLRDTFQELATKGCLVMMSNSANPVIRELYCDFRIISVGATRNINSIGEARGKIEELLIMSYGPD